MANLARMRWSKSGMDHMKDPSDNDFHEIQDQLQSIRRLYGCQLPTNSWQKPTDAPIHLGITAAAV